MPTEPGVKPKQSGFKMWVLHPSLSDIASQLNTIHLHYFLIQQIFTECLLYDRYRYSYYLGWGLQGSKQINKQTKTPHSWHNNRGKIFLKLISKNKMQFLLTLGVAL